LLSQDVPFLVQWLEIKGVDFGVGRVGDLAKSGFLEQVEMLRNCLSGERFLARRGKFGVNLEQRLVRLFA
jgi:hypothetical protein